MSWLLNILKIFYVQKVGESAGRKPWEDKTLLSLIASFPAGFIANMLLQHWGIVLGADEQAGLQALLVVVVGIIFRLASPHVGIRPQTVLEVIQNVPSAPVADPQAGTMATVMAEKLAEPEPVNTMGRQDAGQ